jgi:hypothetical protein
MTSYVLHTLSSCAVCGASGDEFGSVNVEAFELDGELVCEECADQYIEDWEENNGQFGVGA